MFSAQQSSVPKITQGAQGADSSPSPEQIQSKFDLSIALVLSTWSALTFAVQNSWGGPQSSEKRDWFAGAISDLIASAPDVDVEYLEQFLFQVMNDEFEINIEDGSGDDIASQIIKLRRLTLEGDFALVDEMYAKWQERQRRGEEAVRFEYVENGEGLEDGDEDSVNLERSADEDEDEDEDIEMEQNLSTPTSLQAKPQPIMDEDGFIKVVHKKKKMNLGI